MILRPKLDKYFRRFLWCFLTSLFAVSCQHARNRDTIKSPRANNESYIAEIRELNAGDESRVIGRLLRTQGIQPVIEGNFGVVCVTVKKSDAIKAVNAIAEEFEIGPKGSVELPNGNTVVIRAPFLEMITRDYSTTYDRNKNPQFRVTPKFNETKIAQVIEQMNQCASWIHLKPLAVEERKDVVECLIRLAHEDNTILRESIRRLCKSKIAAGNYSVEDMGKLHVLISLVFDAPPRWGLQDLPPGGGWVDAPHGSDYLDLLWPLSVTPDGLPVLTGTFYGYNGPSYNALDEFDWFSERFLRRPLK
jgi:hypothetical protein